MIGVDPIGAYLGETDSHRDASMRGLLLPLAAMAERGSTAVVAIAHLNKTRKDTSPKALYRTTGSIAYRPPRGWHS
jgi:putative DNA primase/helicase